MPQRWVEVLVARSISATASVGLPNPAGSVNEFFIEATVTRLVRVFIAEVPLSENA
jgi:hypothetical protein